jgi:hypothetical protein
MIGEGMLTVKNPSTPAFVQPQQGDDGGWSVDDKVSISPVQASVMSAKRLTIAACTRPPRRSSPGSNSTFGPCRDP